MLQKRKVLLDAFGKGLQEVQLVGALHAFPDLFKPLFVALPPCIPENVWRLLRFEQPVHESEDRARVAGYLRRFVMNQSESGE